MTTPHFHTLTIAELRRETPDAVSIRFDIPQDLGEAYRFQQGQYLTLRKMLDGEDVRRSYSICSGLDDGELRVAVKQVEGGLFSTLINTSLKAGDQIDVMTPMGRFTTPLAAEEARVYLGVAAGSGITPLMSIIKTILTREPRSEFILFYGNKSSQTILFKDALDDLKDRFTGRLSIHHILSREAQDVPLLHGRLDAARIETLLRTIGKIDSIDHAFLCGPQGMIEQGRAVLEGLGVPHAQIHSELFTPSTPTRAPIKHSAAEAPTATATITFDGAVHTVPVAQDESLIDAAIRAGLELPFSCKGGMCCTCRAKLVSGTVDMVQNFSLEPWEVEQGFVLTCQCHPTSSNVAVDFDHL